MRYPVNTPVRVNARGVHDVLLGQRPCRGCQAADFMTRVKHLHLSGSVGRVVSASDEDLEVRFGNQTLPMKDLWVVRVPDEA